MGILTNDQRLQNIRKIARLLDTAFRVPGTRVQFGWDAIIGLVPWLGDTVTAMLASVILVQAHKMRVPRIIQLRMLLNVALDIVVGLVPFFGDVADVFWKANTRNLALLERHAAQPMRATPGDWLFVVGILAAVGLLAAVPILVLYWLVGAIAPPQFKL